MNGEENFKRLPRQSLKPHDSGDNSVEWKGWFSFPLWSNTSSCNGIKGDMENVDIGFANSHTGLDLTQLSPGVWRENVCKRNTEKQKKHIRSKCWDWLVTGQTCFLFSGNISASHSFLFVFPGVILQLLPLNLIGKQFWISAMWAEVIHNVRQG